MDSDSSEILWFFNKYYLIYKLVSRSHTYPNAHKRRLARPNALLLHLPLEIVTECRALAHLPTSISSATHPSCLSQERGRSSRGDQAASICLEHLRQKELNTRTLSPSPPHTEVCYYHFIPKLAAQEGPRTLERIGTNNSGQARLCLTLSSVLTCLFKGNEVVAVSGFAFCPVLRPACLRSPNTVAVRTASSPAQVRE